MIDDRSPMIDGRMILYYTVLFAGIAAVVLCVLSFSTNIYECRSSGDRRIEDQTLRVVGQHVMIDCPVLNDTFGNISFSWKEATHG